MHLYGSYNQLNNMITLIPVPLPPKYQSDEGRELDGAMQYINAEDAKIWELEYAMTWAPVKYLKLSMGYTLTNTSTHVYDSELTKKGDGKPVIVERPIDGTSKHKGQWVLPTRFAKSTTTLWRGYMVGFRQIDTMPTMAMPLALHFGTSPLPTDLSIGSSGISS